MPGQRTMIADLVRKNRSCRRFYEDGRIDPETLKELVNLGRLSASGANLQPLKYILSTQPDKNSEIFTCLGWAGYLKGWPGPVAGERPAAYIVVLGDTRLARDVGCDHGIASQSILLGAREKGLGGCLIGSINREKLGAILAVPPGLDILLVIALGKPREQVVIEPVGEDNSIRYWRDDKGVHHVPKRSLEEIIVESYT